MMTGQSQSGVDESIRLDEGSVEIDAECGESRHRDGQKESFLGVCVYRAKITDIGQTDRSRSKSNGRITIRPADGNNAKSN